MSGHETPQRPPGVPEGEEAESRVPAMFLSVRFRLTILYSAMLFGLASILVGGIYWGLARSLDEQIADQLARQAGTPAFDIEQDEFEQRRELELLVDAQTLANLQRYSRWGLGLLFVTSFGVGWITAGRVLMPIGRITRVAQDIQATDLSRRIGMLGVDDEIKQLADTFDAMLDRLQHAFNNQQRLIQDTSHELRNPLAVIRTNLDVTLSDPDADVEQYQHTAEVVQRSAERMTKLVDDLLAYARHEATNRVEAPFDLADTVRSLVDEFDGPASKEGLELRLDLDDELPVLGHERSIEQAVANLLANAVRFAPVDSTIHLIGGADSSWIWLTVADEGPGIPEPDRDRIFQRYVRLGEGEAGRPHLAGGEGSGLGLAIVREIVQSHRGEVSVIESELGATIAIWLPRHRVHQMVGEPKRKRQLPRPRQRSKAAV